MMRLNMLGKLSLFIIWIIYPCLTHAQINTKALESFPLMYNNADSSIIVLQQNLNKTNNDVQFNFYTQWAVIKLYQHLGNTVLRQGMFENMFKTSERGQHNNLFLIALVEQVKMYELLNNRNKLKETLIKLKTQSLKNNSTLAHIEYLFIDALYITQKSDSCLVILQRAIKLAKESESKEQLLQAYLFTGQLLINKKSLYAESIQYFDSVNSLSHKWNAKKYIALSYMNKGYALSHQGKFDSAIAYHRDALTLSLQLKDLDAIILNYKYIGNCNNDISNYTEAIKYYQQGVELSLKTNYKKHLALLYHNIGNIYVGTDSDSSLFYLEKAINIAKANHDTHAEALASYTLSQHYINEEAFLKAKKLMEQAIRLFKSIDEYNNVSWVLPQIVSLDLDVHKRNSTKPNHKEINQLLIMLAEAVSLNADGNNFQNLQSIYKNYTQLAIFSNDYKMASLYQAKLIALNDSIYNQQRIRAAFETSEKLKTAEQKNKIATLELKSIKDRNRQQLIWMLLALTIVGSILFYVNYRKRMKLKNARLLRKQKEEFRNQLSNDLHDEVGTMLTGLAMQSEMVSLSASEHQKESLEEISTMSKEAMEQLRDIVWTIDSRKDKFENLFARMRIYTEQHLHIKNISHQFEIIEEEKFSDISPEVRQNVYLIFKEAIANIIKHSNASFVQIRIFRSGQKIRLIISDNGTLQKQHNTDGLGLESMKQRAKTIHGNLSIDTQKGYSIILEF